MEPATIRRIVQEIRHRRALLTAEEAWLQRQPPSSTRAEGFRQIRFWREVLADAEHKVGRDPDDTEGIAHGT